MGEYAEKNGQRIKLGTCEDLMYVTREDVVALKSAGWHGDGGARDLGIYLTVPSSRFRLAIEADVAGDAAAIDRRKPEVPTVRINIDPEGPLCDLLLDVVEHRQCYTPLNHTYGASPNLSARIKHPCPLTREWRINSGPCKLEWNSLYVELAWEGAGNGRAVYRCPMCGGMFNLYGDGEKEAQYRAQMLDAYRQTHGDRGGMYREYIERLIQAAPVAVPV